MSKRQRTTSCEKPEYASFQEFEETVRRQTAMTMATTVVDGKRLPVEIATEIADFVPAASRKRKLPSSEELRATSDWKWKQLEGEVVDEFMEELAERLRKAAAAGRRSVLCEHCYHFGSSSLSKLLECKIMALSLQFFSGMEHDIAALIKAALKKEGYDNANVDVMIYGDNFMSARVGIGGPKASKLYGSIGTAVVNLEW